MIQKDKKTANYNAAHMYVIREAEGIVGAERGSLRESGEASQKR